MLPHGLVSLWLVDPSKWMIQCESFIKHNLNTNDQCVHWSIACHKDKLAVMFYGLGIRYNCCFTRCSPLLTKQCSGMQTIKPSPGHNTIVLKHSIAIELAWGLFLIYWKQSHGSRLNFNFNFSICSYDFAMRMRILLVNDSFIWQWPVQMYIFMHGDLVFFKF